MPIGTIFHFLKHTAATVTEKCYVKFRETGLHQAREIMEQNIPHVAEYVAKCPKNQNEIFRARSFLAQNTKNQPQNNKKTVLSDGSSGADGRI